MNPDETKDFIAALEGKHYKYLKKDSNPPKYSKWMNERDLLLDPRYMGPNGID